MSNDVLVRVDNVSKRFCRSLKRSLWYGLQDLGSELGGRRHGGGGGLPQSSADVELRKDEFWALKDISLELKRGECLSVVGRNGSGKSTLLRIISGLIKPDTGLVEQKGKLLAIIALGAGFNPILTGRENIFVVASILGKTAKETLSIIDEVVEFAELDSFIDSPVQSYSSGMLVRLGFSVSTCFSPDVLILDEVLAVGDASFKAKCLERISNIRRNCATIFVSHNMMQTRRISTSVLDLSIKSPKMRYDVPEAIADYEAQSVSISSPHSPRIYFQRYISVLSINEFAFDLHASQKFKAGQQITICLSTLDRHNAYYILQFTSICSESDCNISVEGEMITQTTQAFITISSELLLLSKGVYSCRLVILNKSDPTMIELRIDHLFYVSSTTDALSKSPVVIKQIPSYI
jgi:ABC-type polysaccharide/polyol phosphate transport system ATPase subunit